MNVDFYYVVLVKHGQPQWVFAGPSIDAAEMYRVCEKANSDDPSRNCVYLVMKERRQLELEHV